MTKSVLTFVLSITFSALLQAAVIDTNNPSIVSAFQSGATIVNFESVSGKTPQTIASYTSGNAVSSTAFVFDQIAGVQFSVGGAPGTNEPALYQLSGGVAGDAHSPTTVLGPVDFDFTTKFNSGSMMELFFPTKVSKVGFWLNPSLGNVELIAADTNFAFSHLTETILETGNVTAGNFVGIERPTADIGGFKILALGATGFTIDDFTFGGTSSSTTPEPTAQALIAFGLISLLLVRKPRFFLRWGSRARKGVLLRRGNGDSADD